MEIELKTNRGEVEIHGPYWYWEKIQIKHGDEVTAKGTHVQVMKPGGRHQELVPYELTINGKTYGDAATETPVWMQE